MQLSINNYISVTGFITQEIYLKNKSLRDIERLLGFQWGRLNEGLIVAALVQIPEDSQYELAGYSQVAGHKFNDGSLKKLDERKLKEILRKEVFALSGNKRLVKVIPNSPHKSSISADLQYPPGLGIPQWKLTRPVTAKVIAIIEPGRIFI